MENNLIDEKVIEVIQHLQKRAYVALDLLAELMDVSTRSVRNYIKATNDELNGTAEIINKRGKGFYLTVHSDADFASFMKQIEQQVNLDSKENRMANIIEYMITTTEHLTIDEMAFNMNLGRTTLVNEISKANALLSSYRLKIVGKPNKGIQLLGDELDLRFFIIDNAFEWIYGRYPLDQDIIDMIHRVSIQHDFESQTEDRMIQFIIVLLDRILNNHKIETLDTKYLALLSSPDYLIAEAFAIGIKERLPVEISTNDVIFLTIPISGRRTPTNDRSLTHVDIPKEVNQIVVVIIREIGFKQDIITQHETFFKDLKYHLTFLLNRLTFGIKLNNPLLPDVKAKYPVAFQMAKIAGDVIQSQFNFKVSEHELGYLAFYFEIFISKSESQVINIKRAAIVCGTGRGTAKLLAIQLQKVFNVEISFDLYSETDSTKQILNQYDIVFSTIRLPYQLDVPSLTISEVFNQEVIQKEVEQLQYMHRYGLVQAVKNDYLLSSLLKKETFFILDAQKNYDTNIADMVTTLVEKHYLDQDFLARLKDRASKGSMIFSNHVAFPHTFNEGAKHVTLAIGTCKNDAETGDPSVKLIFLLGIPAVENS